MNEREPELREDFAQKQPIKQRSSIVFFRRLFIGVFVSIAVFGLLFSSGIISSSDSSGSFPSFSFFDVLKHLVSADERELEGEEDDRVNFLMMGIGGAGHDGPQLTDTIIFASLKPTTQEIGMMSLPRDMSVPIPGYGYRKVNHANAFGEINEPGAGPLLAATVIGDVLDQDVHYYMRVDFNGFSQLIDDLGGIDVYVDQTFTDYKYPSHGKAYSTCGYTEPVEELATGPIEESTLETDSGPTIANLSDEVTDTVSGEVSEEAEVVPTVIRGPDYSCRFEVLHFEEGWVHLDGDTALKYVRSRHGNNGEGSDFARSRRQQKVLLGIKDKSLSAGTLLNPTKISTILDTLRDHISTNLDVWEIVRLAREFKDLNLSEITNHVIDSSPDSPLYATSLNGAYVLLPKNDDWRPLQRIAESIFIQEEASVLADAPEEKPRFVRIEIQNGTNITGLAFRSSQLLDGQGYEVKKIGNALSRGYEHTVIYDLTNGKRAEELGVLKDFLQADVTLSATGWLASADVVPKEISFSQEDYEDLATEDEIDFLVILGEDSESIVKQ